MTHTQQYILILLLAAFATLVVLLYLYPTKPIIITILSSLINIFNKIIKNLSSKANVKVLPITSIIRNDTERSLQYSLVNDQLLSHKDVLKAIYLTLIGDLTFKKFGKYKVIIVSAIVDGHEFNYHHNVLLTNTTTFDQYYEKVKDIIATHFDKGYQIDVVNSFKITV